MEEVLKLLENGDKHKAQGRQDNALASYIKAINALSALEEQSQILPKEHYRTYFLAELRFCDSARIDENSSDIIKIYRKLLDTPYNRSLDMIVCLERIGDILFKFGKYEKALEYYEKGTYYVIKGENEHSPSDYVFSRARVNNYERISQALYKLRRYDEALEVMHMTRDIINQGIKQGHPLFYEAQAIISDIDKTSKMISQFNKIFKEKAI